MKTLFILLFISVCWAQASQPQPSFAQRLLGLINGQTGTEEHLLHLEPVGSYLVSADGQRLAGEAYLSFAVSNGGAPVTEDGSVQVEAALYHLPASDVEGQVEALLTTLKPLETTTYSAELVGDKFVVDPLDVSAVESFDWQTSGWLSLNIKLDGPAGKAERELGLSLYPVGPETGLWLKLLSITVPAVILLSVLGAFQRVNVRLSRSSGNEKREEFIT